MWPLYVKASDPERSPFSQDGHLIQNSFVHMTETPGLGLTVDESHVRARLKDDCGFLS